MTERALSGADQESILVAAVSAPSMHNTQPWRFRFAGPSVEVYRDRARELPAEDPERRMLFVSLGAAIFNLRVGAAACGYGGRVQHPVDRLRPDLVAVVELEHRCGEQLAALAPYLGLRRTNRQPYAEERIPAQVRAELDLAARNEGARLQWLDQPSRRRWLRTATIDAGAADDPARTAERRQWVGGVRNHDGVPSSALGPRATSGGEPQLAVLATRFDGPVEWLRAGQAMENVLLRATALGLATALLNQVVEHPELRRMINDPLGTWQRPQAVLRLGYGPVVPPTPRRPIDDVLIRT